MNESKIISWEEAERMLGDMTTEPVKCSLPPQTRPSETDNETNVDRCIQQLMNNDPKLTEINLNNMKVRRARPSSAVIVPCQAAVARRFRPFASRLSHL